jgi:two-component sensor histidine kinase
MAIFSEQIRQQTSVSQPDLEWLTLLMADWQMLADLVFADLVLWLPTNDGEFIAAGHARPSSSATIFYRDIDGELVRKEWVRQIKQAFTSGKTVNSAEVKDRDGIAIELSIFPVRRPVSPRSEEVVEQPIAVISCHTNLTEFRSPNKLQLNYLAAGHDLLEMVSDSGFPGFARAGGARRGSARITDGMLRLNEEGIVTFASPNALSIFNRFGVRGELEGESLATATGSVVSKAQSIDEGFALVVSGRAPWSIDLESRQMTISARSIPLRKAGKRVGALVLVRDVTAVRKQERELITKDATIREIHHRVKNNLQTVASLLRMQARRSDSQEARDSLDQAMRRVSAIALVHDTLSEGLNQDVNFDEVFDRVMMLASEVAASHGTTVKTLMDGKFGQLRSDIATPLAVALTELVTNAVEHGLDGRSGVVHVSAERKAKQVLITVSDNGKGLVDGKVGDGLGTQIIKTLIEGELRGSIHWFSPKEGGARVTIALPL